VLASGLAAYKPTGESMLWTGPKRFKEKPGPVAGTNLIKFTPGTRHSQERSTLRRVATLVPRRAGRVHAGFQEEGTPRRHQSLVPHRAGRVHDDSKDGSS
jgi:hypothetical protein